MHNDSLILDVSRSDNERSITFRVLLFTGILAFAQVIGISCSDRKAPLGSARGENSNTASLADMPTRNSSNSAGDFVAASGAAMPAVVHIKTSFNSSSYGSALPFGREYGASPREGVPVGGSGSGVTISADGYIATNNHVVENAESIEVIFPDRRAFTARLIGTDPNTDLALLKVDGKDLPSVKFGNSDIVQVGQWVLAVGYPFSLNSTVTAGIISAKGRSIGIINRPTQQRPGSNQPSGGNTAIESFLQTDAAINPGNSGGALVNTNGELVGINTAIASQTGSYAGYAFAIPVNLAKKILDDLKEHGTVKRGILGISFPSPVAEDQYLKAQGINPGSVHGVYVMGVQDQSAAAQAGLKEGDIIQSIDGIELFSSSEFSERIARHRPGDAVKLTYLRKGKTYTASATLKAEKPIEMTANNSRSLAEIYNRLGASFAPLPGAWKERLNLRSGVVVTEVRKGGFFDQMGIPEGTVIALINSRPVNSPQDIEQALLSTQQGIIQIFAVAPDGSRVVFNLSLGT
jgi:serine protease Do